MHALQDPGKKTSINSLYSEERTAEYEVQKRSYSLPHEEHPGNSPTIWQVVTRASTRRQAAHTLVPPLQAESSGGSNAPSSKRAFPNGEATPAPKAKRPKAKAKTTDSETPSKSTAPASRRGYNAKRHSKAPFISAQNDVIHKAQRGQITRGTNEPQTPRQDSGAVYFPTLQYVPCMSKQYRNEEFSHCVSCTRRQDGDTCRFQGIRYLMRDENEKLVGISFSESLSVAQMPKMAFPPSWNRKVEREHVRRSKLSIANALLPTLRQEQDHLKVEGIIRRPLESDVRVTCDTCMTSLFSTSFMCRLCGQEVCNECFQQARDFTQAAQNTTSTFTTKSETHAHANPLSFICLKSNEHSMGYITPVTRFVGPELDRTIQEMQEILDKESVNEYMPTSQMTPLTNPPGSNVPSDTNHDHPQSSPPPIGAIHIPPHRPQPALLTRPEPPATGTAYSAYCAAPADVFPDPLAYPVYDAYIPSNAPEHITSIPTYPIQFIPANLYDPPKVSTLTSTSSTPPSPAFATLWRLGLPLLVKGVLERFKIRWDPQYFIERYGDQSCLVIECQTEESEQVPVSTFFRQFGQYKDRGKCWKLKDWPPTAEFKSTFPELFEDFSNAVPVPDYVRRDGVFNISSHFPSNAIGPDLGPKMYNAMASSQEAGSKGSTRLHMDMADALNVMLYSSSCEDGSVGYAAWDLFRAEDSDKIRSFLRKRFGDGPLLAPATPAPGNGQPEAESGKAAAGKGAPPAKPNVHVKHDPIHRQQFYLDVELRKELWEEYGVKSYRVYQRPGDAVFIPAGCAHQVANMADCIKIAIDFVSPENIDRCEKLTKEFREQNQNEAWKEDVLQLRTMMWFAWQSCSLLEAGLDEEAASLAAAGIPS